MDKLSKKGFTLAELLIVVAIIGVLVGISIPIFTNQLEKSRDAVSVTNIRNAYAWAMAEYITCTISDSNMEGVIKSYVIEDGGKKIGTVNFRNGRIIQISRINVTLSSTKANNWSGLADNLPFHDKMMNGSAASPFYGDNGVPRKYAMITFNFDDNGSGHIGSGENWDGIDAAGRVTSVTVTDTPNSLRN